MKVKIEAFGTKMGRKTATEERDMATEVIFKKISARG